MRPRAAAVLVCIECGYWVTADGARVRPGATPQVTQLVQCWRCEREARAAAMTPSKET